MHCVIMLILRVFILSRICILKTAFLIFQYYHGMAPSYTRPCCFGCHPLRFVCYAWFTLKLNSKWPQKDLTFFKFSDPGFYKIFSLIIFVFTLLPKSNPITPQLYSDPWKCPLFLVEDGCPAKVTKYSKSIYMPLLHQGTFIVKI